MTDAVPSRRRAYCALLFLLLTYMMSFADRTALGVLQEGIKRDLSLSDWQLGLLSGPAFAILYSIAGVPIARLAERRSRSLILAASLSVWSLATMACGLASNYAQLLVARMAVSIGEAGGNPASHSLIADLFPPHARGRALAIYSFGVPVGAFLGAAMAGWMAHHWGWRTAFFLLGPPGLLLALLAPFALASVPRGRFDRPDAREPEAGGRATGDAPPLSVVLGAFFGNPVLRQMAAGASIVVLVGFGIAAFLPSFLIRRYGLDLGSVGLFAGLISGVGAGVGTLASGFAIDRYGPRNMRLYGWLPAAALVVSFPAFLLGFLTTSLWMMALLLTIGMGALYVYIAPTFAQLHNMMESRMRATAASIMYLIINLVGLGLGPPAIGRISDHMTMLASGRGAQDAAAQGITHALMIISALLLWAAVHFWLAGRALWRAQLAAASTARNAEEGSAFAVRSAG